MTDLRYIDPISRQPLLDEIREFVVPQHPGIGALRPQLGCRYQRRRCQSAALTLMLAYLYLGVGGRVGRNVEQIIDGGAAEAHDVITHSAVHGIRHYKEASQ